MKVLIVDDSRAMRMIVKRTLKQAGFDASVTEAENGKQALDAINAGKPDLVLTDWAMPEMNGLELVQAITDNGLDVPVGMVTSQGTPEMKEQAKEAGARFMLTKPFTADGLRDALDGVV